MWTFQGRDGARNRRAPGKARARKCSRSATRPSEQHRPVARRTSPKGLPSFGPAASLLVDHRPTGMLPPRRLAAGPKSWQRHPVLECPHTLVRGIRHVVFSHNYNGLELSVFYRVKVLLNRQVGREVAFTFLRHTGLLNRVNHRPSFMKKSSRRDCPSEPTHRSQRACQQKGGSEGRWEFTASGSLISLGSIDAVRRAAYRTAEGELRFLPL